MENIIYDILYNIYKLLSHRNILYMKWTCKHLYNHSNKYIDENMGVKSMLSIIQNNKILELDISYKYYITKMKEIEDIIRIRYNNYKLDLSLNKLFIKACMSCNPDIYIINFLKFRCQEDNCIAISLPYIIINKIYNQKECITIYKKYKKICKIGDIMKAAYEVGYKTLIYECLKDYYHIYNGDEIYYNCKNYQLNRRCKCNDLQVINYLIITHDIKCINYDYLIFSYGDISTIQSFIKDKDINSYIENIPFIFSNKLSYIYGLKLINTIRDEERRGHIIEKSLEIYLKQDKIDIQLYEELRSLYDTPLFLHMLQSVIDKEFILYYIKPISHNDIYRISICRLLNYMNKEEIELHIGKNTRDIILKDTDPDHIHIYLKHKIYHPHDIIKYHILTYAHIKSYKYLIYYVLNDDGIANIISEEMIIQMYNHLVRHEEYETFINLNKVLSPY